MTAFGALQAEHLATGALLAGGGVLATLPTPRARPWWPTSAAAAVLAVTVATGVAALLPHRAGLAAATLLAGGAIGWLTPECVTELRRHRAPSWLPVVLLGATALGVAAAVPDTEVPWRVIGCLGAVGLLALAAPVLRVPTAGPGVWVVPALVVVWAASVGATGRPAAFLGTLACFGAIVALPLAVRITARWAQGGHVWWPVVLAAHAPLVVFGGRGAGLERGVLPALVPAVAALAGLVAFFAVVLVLTARWSRRRARSVALSS